MDEATEMSSIENEAIKASRRQKVDFKKMKKGLIKNRESIVMWLWILFGIVAIVGIYQVIFTILFYEPPSPLYNGIDDIEQWYALCIGIFILLAGAGIMIHGFNIVTVNTRR